MSNEVESSKYFEEIICTCCGIAKSFDCFAKNKARKSGYNNWCKDCHNEWYREYHYPKIKNKHTKQVLQLRNKRIEEYNKHNKKYMKTRREKERGKLEWELKKIITDAKKRAKRKKLQFEIDYNYCLNIFNKQKGHCAISGRKLTLGNKGRLPNSLSIDRIVPSKGYIKGNIRFVVWAINVAMQEWGFDHLMSLCETVLNEKS